MKRGGERHREAERGEETGRQGYRQRKRKLGMIRVQVLEYKLKIKL